MIDRYIDGLAASLNSGRSFSTFGRTGSLFNVVVCAAIIVSALWNGIVDPPFGLVIAAGAIAMEVVFARIAFRAWRGDFDVT